MNNRLRAIIITALITVFLYSSVNMGYELIKRNQEKQANEELRQLMASSIEPEEESPALPEIKEENEAPEPDADAEQEPAEPSETPEPTPSPEPEILPQYEALYELNDDMVGWLSIEDTKIDYPVMYTPEDQNYYIHRAFDDSEAYSGCLFIGINWDETTNQTIIYGHNMKDRTMFGTLMYYESEAYAEEHPIINFNTLYEQREYTVIAAFHGKKYDAESDEEGFRYYWYTDLSDEEVFDEFIEQVKEESIYDTDFDVEFGSRILTLSTCSYHTTDGRFVVVAVEKNS